MFLPWRRPLLRSSALAAALSSLALLAACSGSGDSAGSARAGACVAPGVTEDKIKIGLLWGDTGPGSDVLRAFRAGVDARLGVANAEGGVGGRQIEYVWRDDASDPSLNLRGARELVEKENVFGVIEGPGGVQGSGEYLAERQVPVTGLGSDPVWGRHDNMFSWVYFPGGEGSSTVWGEFIRSQGGTTAALVKIPLNAAFRGFEEQFLASLRAADISVPVSFEVTAEVTGFDSLARQMKAANVDILTGVLLPQVLAQILPAAQRAGVDLKVVLTPMGYDHTLLQQLGPTIAGTVVSSNFVPFEANTPAHQRLLQAMATYVPQIQPPSQDSAVYGWLAADLFLRGLEVAGACPTRQSFIEGLRTVHDYDGGGLLPEPVDLATNRGKTANCYTFVQVSPDGTRFVPLDPVVRCGTPIT